MNTYFFILTTFISLILLTHGVDWKLEDQMNHPSQRGAASMNSINRRFVLFGGYNECFNPTTGCDNQFYNEIWQYLPDYNTWYQGNPTLPIPEPRGYIGSDKYILKSSIIYFGGGSFNSAATIIHFFNDIWEYFPESDQFIKRISINSGPSKRLGSSLTIFGDTAYIFGGIDETFTYKNDLWKYNLVNNSWTLLIADSTPGSPGFRSSPLSQLRVNLNVQEIIIYGGDTSPAGSGNQQNDTWIYNIQTNTWKLIPSAVPGPLIGRTYGASAFYNDKFIISLGDKKNDQLACRTSNEASGGQFPTNQTWYLNFRDNDENALNLNYEKAFTQRPPNLKRVASTQDEKKIMGLGRI